MGIPFGLEDPDEGGPTSSTSTTWELRFTLDGCPRALEGIMRIVWFNTVIIIQYPHMRGRQKCLRSGKLGHLMRTCSMTKIGLKGQGGMVTSEAEIAHMPKVPQTFASLEELRNTVEEHRQRPSDMTTPTIRAIPVAREASPPTKEGATSSERTETQHRGQRSHMSSGTQCEWFDGGKTKNPTRGQVPPQEKEMAANNRATRDPGSR